MTLQPKVVAALGLGLLPMVERDNGLTWIIVLDDV